MLLACLLGPEMNELLKPAVSQQEQQVLYDDDDDEILKM